ncbi:TonB system transport protein ExbD [Hyphomicrobium sp. CS1BSMeth3]|uniref:TonB system transport protein ExbD n=1 Tax=Hyphomicrobium sp. CS1BSMeth3 TaxID=1892844 RepID=UPI0009308736|nr:TonB system transport protein ExbD [Hyphomicrobium sp. CS1BSMeth3]
MAGGIRERDDEEDTEVYEINVTPFIDVILVLLIVFMVAAPLSTVDIAVQLPAATAKPQPRPEKPIYVTIKSNLEIAVGEDTVAKPLFLTAITRVTEGNRDTRLFLRADKTVPYGELIGVLDQLRAAGYLKVGLVALEAVRPAGFGAQETPAPASPAPAGSQ